MTFKIVGEHSKNMHLNILLKRLTFLIVSRKTEDFQNVELTHNNQSIERVKKCRHLGIANKTGLPTWKSNVE